MRTTRPFRFAAGILAITAAHAAGQELEPRSYSASPTGAHFAAVAYGISTGDIIFDPSVPITDVKADVRNVAVGIGQTFAIGHMQGLFTAAIPYAWGYLSGKVGGTTDSAVSRAGIADARLKVSLNIIGSPALTPQMFASTPASRFIFGASLALAVPTGQYDPQHLINVGTNRWAWKPEVGASYNFNKKLYLDLYAGVWLFAPNYDFYPGTAKRTQDPLTSLQAHASYTFAKWIWVAADATYYAGGGTQVNGGPTTARQDNSRIGLIAAITVGKGQQVKFNYSDGASARVGSKFQTFGIGYQVLWF
jgi:hypothetical protein